MIKFNSLLAISLVVAAQLGATDYVWFPGTTNAYNTAANWTPPNNFTQTGDSIIFNQFTPSTNLVVTISETLSNIIFDTTTSYSITAAAFDFELRGAAPRIDVLAGSHTLNIPLLLFMDTTLTVNSGASITFGANTTFTSPATLTITGEGDVFFQNTTSPYGVANMVINGVTITNTNGQNPTATGTMIINSGTILNHGQFFATSTPVVTINGGTITNFPGNVLADDVGVFTINGGTITNDAAIFGANNYVENILNGGTINNINAAIAWGGTTLSTINGGTFNNETGSTMNSAAIVMNGGTFNNRTGATGLVGNVTTTINGGEINNSASLFTGSPLVTINGGTINNESGGSIDGNVINMNGGTIFNETGGLFVPPVFSLRGGTVFNNGTMTIPVYQQQGGGTLVIQITDPSTHGSLTAATSLSLDGTFGAQGNPGFNVQPGEQIPVISAPSGYSGRFSDVIGLNLPDLFPLLTYDPTTIFVSFIPTLFSYPNIAEAIFASVNHVNLDLARRMNRLHENMGSFNSAASTQLSVQSFPEPDELLASASTEIVATQPSQRKQEDLKQAVASEQPRKLNLYIGPIGSLGTVDSKEGQAGYDYSSVGAIVGLDYAFSKVGLGFLFDYEFIDADGKHHWGNFDVNQVHGSLYATYLPVKEFAINTIVGGGYEWYDIERKTGLLSHRVKAKGSPNGNEFDALLGVEYNGKIDTTMVMPYLNAQYIFLHIDQYHEKNAELFNLKIASQRAKSFRSMMGMRINHTWQQTDFAFCPELNVAWQHEFLDKHRSILVSPIEIVGPSSSATLAEAGRNTGLVGLNLLFTFFDRYGLEANYDYEWNKRYQDHFFLASFNVRF